MIKYEEQPQLFSIIFGEGITNDAVSIILFNTVEPFIGTNGQTTEDFTWVTPFKIIGNFLLLGIVSLLIGITFGLLASILFKKIRLLTISSIKETIIIFIFGYLAYSFSSLAGMSGIISLLTAGITMAHYGWYNLSPQGKHVSTCTFQVIGYATEAFIFGYLGLTFFSRSNHQWSP